MPRQRKGPPRVRVAVPATLGRKAAAAASDGVAAALGPARGGPTLGGNAGVTAGASATPRPPVAPPSGVRGRGPRVAGATAPKGTAKRGERRADGDAATAAGRPLRKVGSVRASLDAQSAQLPLRVAQPRSVADRAADRLHSRSGCAGAIMSRSGTAGSAGLGHGHAGSVPEVTYADAPPLATGRRAGGGGRVPGEGLAVTVLRRWDSCYGSTARQQRAAVLADFVARYDGMTGSAIDADLGGAASLLLSRFSSWLRVSYSRGHAANLELQLQALSVFLVGAAGTAFLSDFVDSGGLLTLLEVVALERAAVTDEARAASLVLLRHIARSGRSYKETMCDANGVSVVVGSLMASPARKTADVARNLLVELGIGNPAHLHDVLRGCAVGLSAHDNMLAQRAVAQAVRSLLAHAREAEQESRIPWGEIVVGALRMLVTTSMTVAFEASEVLAVAAARTDPDLRKALIEGLLVYLRNPSGSGMELVRAGAVAVVEGSAGDVAESRSRRASSASESAASDIDPAVLRGGLRGALQAPEEGSGSETAAAGPRRSIRNSMTSIGSSSSSAARESDARKMAQLHAAQLLRSLVTEFEPDVAGLDTRNKPSPFATLAVEVKAVPALIGAMTNVNHFDVQSVALATVCSLAATVPGAATQAQTILSAPLWRVLSQTSEMEAAAVIVDHLRDHGTVRLIQKRVADAGWIVEAADANEPADPLAQVVSLRVAARAADDAAVHHDATSRPPSQRPRSDSGASSGSARDAASAASSDAAEQYTPLVKAPKARAHVKVSHGATSPEADPLKAEAPYKAQMEALIARVTREMADEPPTVPSPAPRQPDGTGAPPQAKPRHAGLKSLPIAAPSKDGVPPTFKQRAFAGVESFGGDALDVARSRRDQRDLSTSETTDASRLPPKAATVEPMPDRFPFNSGETKVGVKGYGPDEPDSEMAKRIKQNTTRRERLAKARNKKREVRQRKLEERAAAQRRQVIAEAAVVNDYKKQAIVNIALAQAQREAKEEAKAKASD